MSRSVRWSQTALADLDDQIAYLASRNAAAARRVVEVLSKTAADLEDMPTGRPGRVAGTYEKSVTGLPYILAYAMLDDAVVILRVVHTSRDWRGESWPD